jgi:hypothetical protein
VKEEFRRTKFKPESLDKIEKVNDVLSEYGDQKLTARQVYYQFVSRSWIPNTPTSYRNMTSLLTDARYAGLVDWNMIEDRGREPSNPSEWDDIGALVDTALRAYRLPRWKGQDHYVELWVEKQALAGVLAPIASRWHVTLMVNKGYCVDPSTRVLTADLRWVSADSVRPGDHLVGVDEKVPGVRKQRRMRRAVVSSVCAFTTPRLIVDTDQGNITVSTNHPFLVTRRNGKGDWNNGWYWVQASALRKGDRIARLCKPWEPKTSYEAGWLAGLYDGEGCLTLAKRVGSLFATVYQKSGPVLDKARQLTKLYGFYNSETRDKSSDCVGVKTYGVDRILELLGTLRPERLLRDFQTLLDRGLGPAKSKTPAVVKAITAKRVGLVIGIETNTKTLITEGFVSHNSSASAMKDSADRMTAACLEGENADGINPEPIVLYLGDHDPSGEDMVRDIEDRLVEFGVHDLEVRKLALTMGQIKKWKPPPNPAKVTDSRAKAYIQKYGDKSWELDALPPRELNRIVEEALAGIVDRSTMDEIVAREEVDKKLLRDAVSKIASKR